MMSVSRTRSEQHKPLSARPALSVPVRASLHPLLRLQQTAGNRAVARLHADGYLQTKLTVSAPDDVYEQEADRVAANVMQRIGSGAGPLGTVGASIQRQPMEEEEELLMPRRGDAIPTIQRQEEEEELLMPRRGDAIPAIQRQEDEELVWMRPAVPMPAVRRQASSEGLGARPSQPTSEAPPMSGRVAAPESSTLVVPESMEARLAGSRGGGQALDRGTRVELERALGFDFGGVRIHTETSADELADQVRAEAFTHDRDIYFRAGRYQPGTENGRFLLTHELAHVIQQGAAAPRRDAGQNAPDATELE